MSSRPQGTDYRAATVQPDGTAVASAAAGVELVRQRNTSGQQRFPDYSSYLRYQRGRVEVQRRATLRALIAGGGPAQTVPDAPTSVSATAGNAQATISFTAPANNGGSAITGYTVTASPGGATANGASSPITVTGLSNGTAYTFTVVATNSIGDSVPSAASLSATPATVPGAPTGVSATAGNTQATVSFIAPANDGGSAITGYTVTASPGGATANGASSPITVTGLSNGTAYTFTVVATNSIGDSVPSAASLSATPATVPGVPTGLSGTAGDKQIQVSFTAPANGGSPITNYQYSTDNGNTYLAFSPADTSSPVTITKLSSDGTTDLTNSVAYTIRLKAVNSIGVSTASSSISVTPILITAPPAPTSLSGVAGNQAIYVLFTQSGNGGSAITNYEYSTDDGATFIAFSPAQTFSPVTITAASSDGTTALTNGVAYTIKLKAVNAVGASVESTSTTVTPAINTLNTTNLLIELDANNASSYSGSGTTWTNLRSSGSYSATLQNSPTFDGTNKWFTFDGNNQIAQIAAAAAINPIAGSSFTIQIWARVNTASPSFTSGDGLISKQLGPSGDYDGYSLTLNKATGQVTLNMNGSSVNGNYSSSTGVYSNSWALYSIVVRFGGGAGSPSYTYVSTRRVVTGNNTETGMPRQAPLQFPRGFQDSTFNFCPADVGAFYLYNTAVSQEDIIRNYDATKERYGL